MMRPPWLVSWCLKEERKGEREEREERERKGEDGGGGENANFTVRFLSRQTGLAAAQGLSL